MMPHTLKIEQQHALIFESLYNAKIIFMIAH